MKVLVPFVFLKNPGLGKKGVLYGLRPIEAWRRHSTAPARGLKLFRIIRGRVYKRWANVYKAIKAHRAVGKVG